MEEEGTDVNISVPPAVEFDVVHLVTIDILKAAIERLQERSYRSFSSGFEVVGVLEMDMHKLKDALGEGAGLEHELINLAVSVLFSIACKRSGTLEL